MMSQSSDDDGISIHEDAFRHLGVTPPHPNYPRRIGRLSWRALQRVGIPLLHTFDPLKPPGRFINVECIWCKAISANDPKSPAFDDGVTYDMLPPITRVAVGPAVVRRLGWLVFPRWIHPLFELRTAYLDGAIAGEVARVRRAADDDRSGVGDEEVEGKVGGTTAMSGKDRTKIRIVSFGAGYDARCVKLSERDDVKVDEYYELDLPGVVDAKRRMMGPERLLRRRRGRGTAGLTECDLPVLVGVDLNDVDGVRSILDDIVTRGGGSRNGGTIAGSGTSANTTVCRRQAAPVARWHTIFVFEGVLMYLKEGVAGEVLRACSASVIAGAGAVHHRADVPGAADPAADGKAGPASSSAAWPGSGSLCFADRVENVPGVDVGLCLSELEKYGWDLVDWTPNERANARHMGTARCFCFVGDE